MIAPTTDEWLVENGLTKGAMMLVTPEQSAALYSRMQSAVEASGGSAANTIAGLASFGGKGAFMGKVANDQLGQVFAHDMRAIGARFENAPLENGPATAVSMTVSGGLTTSGTTPVPSQLVPVMLSTTYASGRYARTVGASRIGVM